MDKKAIIKATKILLLALGKDVGNRDLAKTPQRVAEMYAEILAGEGRKAEDEISVILEQRHDEIILVKDIPIYSLCEHHLLPFFGFAHIAYIPDKRITGLSKIARVADILARRLQVQERLTTQIADVIMRKLSPKGVMVVIEAEHLCMVMRGVKKPGSLTVTSVVRGIFRRDSKARQEALALIQSSASSQIKR